VNFNDRLKVRKKEKILAKKRSLKLKRKAIKWKK